MATLLLQPNLPSVVLIDEPELGLHPAAIQVLAGMLQSASTRTQLLVATQSVTLVNQLEQDQVWVVYSEMQIVAACRIQNKHDFLFLSTVFVAPQHRAKGLAKQLVCAAIKQQSMPLYTFAYKNITALYTSLGFNQVLTYTPGLKALFDIYTHRNIVALEYL